MKNVMLTYRRKNPRKKSYLKRVSARPNLMPNQRNISKTLPLSLRCLNPKKAPRN
jgi:hypothetical protein